MARQVENALSELDSEDVLPSKKRRRANESIADSGLSYSQDLTQRIDAVMSDWPRSLALETVFFEVYVTKSGRPLRIIKKLTSSGLCKEVTEDEGKWEDVKESMSRFEKKITKLLKQDPLYLCRAYNYDLSSPGIAYQVLIKFETIEKKVEFQQLAQTNYRGIRGGLLDAVFLSDLPSQQRKTLFVTE